MVSTVELHLQSFEEFKDFYQPQHDHFSPFYFHLLCLNRNSNSFDSSYSLNCRDLFEFNVYDISKLKLLDRYANGEFPSFLQNLIENSEQRTNHSEQTTQKSMNSLVNEKLNLFSNKEFLDSNCFIIQLLKILLKKFKIESRLQTTSIAYSCSFCKMRAISCKDQANFLENIIAEKKRLFLYCKKLINFVHLEHPKDLERSDAEIFEISQSKKFTPPPKDRSNKNNTLNLIKELTIKSLEPNIEQLILKHNEKVKELNSLHQIELKELEENIRSYYLRLIKNLREGIDIQMRASCNSVRIKTIQESQEMHSLKFVESEKRRKYFLNHFINSKLCSVILELNGLRQILTAEKDSLTEINLNFSHYIKNITNRLTVEISQKISFSVQKLIKKVDSKSRLLMSEYGNLNDRKIQFNISQECSRLKMERDSEIENLIITMEKKINGEMHSKELSGEKIFSSLREDYESKLNQLIIENQELIKNSYISQKFSVREMMDCKDTSHPPCEYYSNSPFNAEELCSQGGSNFQEIIGQLRLENEHLKNYILKNDSR